MINEFDKVLDMLNSGDDEMVALGAAAFGKLCNGWVIYNEVRADHRFKILPNEIRKAIRKVMIADYGVTRTKYKRW